MMQQLLDATIYVPVQITKQFHLDPIWTITVTLILFFIEAGLVYLSVKAIFFVVQRSHQILAFILRRLGVGEKDTAYTLLQLIFPVHTTKSAYATQQLHIIMRDLVTYRTIWERLAGRKQPYSLELVATQKQGIRYIIRIPTEKTETFKRTLLSFSPAMKITEVKDYLEENTNRGEVKELALNGDFILPIAETKALAEHDHITYLTGYMRNLVGNQLVSLQVVTVPVLPATHHAVLRRVKIIQQRISRRKELSSQLNTRHVTVPIILWKIIYTFLFLFILPLKLMVGIIESFVSNDLPESWKTNSNLGRSGDSREDELSTIVKQKIDQPLFEVSIRILVVGSDEDDSRTRMDSLISSFQSFTTQYQSLYTPRTILSGSSSQKLSRFKARVLSSHRMSWPTVLSGAELSDLYHLPNTTLTKTEDLRKSRSRDLPAPLSFKGDNSQLDVVIGSNEFGGKRLPIGMTLEQRQKHTYIIGKTGTGKTTLLKSSIYQDMVNGKGLAVFDPHGDLFHELLRIIPEHRQKDVVVFDPSDTEYPIGINILDPDIEFESEDDKHEWITSTVQSVFKKLADEDQWGPRMAHILRNATMTALQLPHPSLYTLQQLLTDTAYQKRVAKTLKDPVLKQFWNKEFQLLGNMQMSNATAPLTHRLGLFITSKRSRHILLQQKSTIKIADIMNEGKILLVNLSKGDIGEDQSMFFGTILTSFIWMAAYQRTKIPENKRRDFFVYVDEFQNFATPQFSDITSEGRKFRVSLIVSHQNIAQIEDKSIVKIVAGNAATIICLKANPEDEAFILPYMKPEVEKGDIVNLTPYHFYMKTTGTQSEDAFSGQTVRLDVESSDQTSESVIRHSRQQHAVPRVEIESYMDELFDELNDRPPTQTVTVTRKSGSDTSMNRRHGA